MANYNPSKWMEQLVAAKPYYGNFRITEINIPGTHESVAMHGEVRFAKCMAYTLSDQLNKGYRFFDIRLKYIGGKNNNPNKLAAYHGPISQKTNLRDITRLHLVPFLQTNNRECIILKIKNEGGNKHQNFATEFVAIMNQFQNIYLWTGQVPTLTQCAGRVVIMATPGKGNNPWTTQQNMNNKIPFVDQKDPGKGYKSIATPAGYRRRWTTFTAHIQTSIATNGHPNNLNELYRSGLNSNSLSALSGNPKKIATSAAAVTKGKGRPIVFANKLNVPGAKYLLDQLYDIQQNNNIECRGRYVGIPQFDFPKIENPQNVQVADRKLVPQELADLIILSNCRPDPQQQPQPQGPYALPVNGGIRARVQGVKAILDQIQIAAPQAKLVGYDDTYYNARNAYDDNMDSYEESQQDLSGFAHIKGRSYHDTVSNGYYHEYGGDDHVSNNSEYIAIFAMVMMIFIGICCLIMVISVSCGFIAGKFYQKTKVDKPRLKHGANSYESEEQV